MLDINIGPYNITKRTSYSKLHVTNNGEKVDDEICEKIIEDYCRQTEDIDGCFTINGDILNDFLCKYSIKYLFIPEGITVINPLVFNNTNVEYVHFPKSLNQIGAFAFRWTNLKEVSVPENVRFIDEAAFMSCKNLSKVDLPSGLEKISKTTFCGCENLEEIYIPNSVSYIGFYAFKDCTKLNRINIPQSIKAFGQFPFENSGIRDLVFGSNIPFCGSPSEFGNFLCNSDIKNIVIDGNTVSNITPNLFNYTEYTKITQISFIGDEDTFDKFRKENSDFLNRFKKAKIELVDINLDGVIKKNIGLIEDIIEKRDLHYGWHEF